MLLCHCLLPCHSFEKLPGEIMLQKSLRASMKESELKKKKKKSRIKVELK